MATAEFAVAIPAIVFVVVIALSAVTTVIDQLRCVDAARATARSLARGDDQGTALAQGRRLAPPGTSFTVGGSATTVTVTTRARPAPALRWLGGALVPHGDAVAAREEVEP
jgi:hypothetical protein